MNGFDTVELVEPNFLHRLIHRTLKGNAFLEIQNLLATTRIEEIRDRHITDILDRHELKLADANESLARFYATATEYLAKDANLTDEEGAALKHLRDVFRLTEEQAMQIHLSVVVPIFEALLRSAISGRQFTNDEKLKFKNLASNLSIPDETVRSAFQRQAIAVYSDEFREAIADKRLSPDEEAHLQQLLSQFGPSAGLAAETQQTWAYFRSLWDFSQGNLPEVDVPVRLQQGEKCAACLAANHYELRTVTKRVGYSGPTASIRIMKGVRWRVGSIGVSSVKEDVLKQLDSGCLYFTNKRLLFDGVKGSKSIPLKKVMNFSFYDDALTIARDTGKDQIFTFSSVDVDALTAILEGLLVVDRN
jgi:hypothetical protein